jgi:hypothetical protein
LLRRQSNVGVVMHSFFLLCLVLVRTTTVYVIAAAVLLRAVLMCLLHLSCCVAVFWLLPQIMDLVSGKEWGLLLLLQLQLLLLLQLQLLQFCCVMCLLRPAFCHVPVFRCCCRS